MKPPQTLLEEIAAGDVALILSRCCDEEQVDLSGIEQFIHSSSAH